jgi:hypothetical protein
MFRVEWKGVSQWWRVNFGVEDGLFVESFRVGEAWRSQQRYELMREQSTAGGESTGKKGGRVYKSDPTDLTRFIEPLNR